MENNILEMWLSLYKDENCKYESTKLKNVHAYTGIRSPIIFLNT